MSQWTKWAGGDCPVAPGTMVEPRYRGLPDPRKGTRIEWPCPARSLEWSNQGNADDIIAYRIVETDPCLN